MKRRKSQVCGLRGGLRANARATRGWRWGEPDRLTSAPVRCKREQWYLARGKLAEAVRCDRAAVLLRFLHHDQTISQRALALHTTVGNGAGGELFGWAQAPESATHLQLRLLDAEQARLFEEVVFHPVAERDPCCHPLANVPRWGVYRPPFPLERVILPPALECLAPLLSEQEVAVVRPRSRAYLGRRMRGAACVLDPAWATQVGLRWADLEQLAAESWLVVDLETVWRLLRRAGLAQARLVTQSSPHGIMSARVEYADVPTRGFALQDVFPYAAIDATGGFAVRVLRANRAWKRYANSAGFATLLSSETPSPEHCGDVLSAARPVGRGELIATDLPWLVAGHHGALLAPRLARHALRMHLGAALDDDIQYWHRWDETQIVVRDIADLARRYPPVEVVRWASADEALVHLGVVVPAVSGAAAGRVFIISTGRIDNLEVHDGLPPEPMIIFMKMLAREVREQTPWAAQHLRDLAVIWQFDTAAGLRYASNYASAASLISAAPQGVRLVRGEAASARRAAPRPRGAPLETISSDEGLFGDAALEFQARLSRRLRRLIERASA